VVVVVIVQEEGRIPKVAVKPLLEHCQKLSEETGGSPAEIFKKFLELMKKYAEYFFGERWREKLDRQFDFSDVDVDFIEGSESYSEECDRFTLVCLRRNISLEGFDSEGFDEDFKFHGNMECWNCVVPDAVWLREKIAQIAQAKKEFEEEAKQEKPSLFAIDMCQHYKRPDVVRSDKMMIVKLKFYEEKGSAEGKTCDVRNMYRCPYGEESGQLIADGKVVKTLWKLIEWYDHYWNPRRGLLPGASDLKWYHYDEPSIIDVTSYDDILKAIDDGRLKRIMEERERYEKEHKG